MRRSRVIVFAVVSFTLAAVACGLQDGGDVVGESRDGSTAGDAVTVDGKIGDSPAGDSPTTGGDSGPSDAGTDAPIVVDAGKPYFCGPIAVADCTTDCPGFQQLCGTSCYAGCGACAGNNFQCDACFGDGGFSVSVCEPQDAAAFSACLNNQSRCPCTDQGNCPGANQTCNGMMCFECDEVDAGNNGDTCKTGGGGHTCHTDPAHIGECF